MKGPILLVDDELEACAELIKFLEVSGHAVDAVAEGNAALEHLQRTQYACILLDIDLGNFRQATQDGLALLRLVRQRWSTPVIIVSSTESPAVRVYSLETGADDYVVKPFYPPEILARIQAILRRQASEPASRSFLDGRIRLEADSRRLLKDGNEIALTPTEFDIFQNLADAAGRVLSRRQLIEGLHGLAHIGDERNIDVHIRHLRTKVEDQPSRPQLIITARGVGYRMAMDS